MNLKEIREYAEESYSKFHSVEHFLNKNGIVVLQAWAIIWDETFKVNNTIDLKKVLLKGINENLYSDPIKEYIKYLMEIIFE